MENDMEIKGQNIINVNVSGPNRSGATGPSKYITVFKDTFSYIATASNKSIIKFFIVATSVCILIIGSKFFYAAADSEMVMEAFSRLIDSKNVVNEEKGIEIRQNIVTPSIQKELRLLCYTLNADRVFIFELHNGKKSAGGLPFIYVDMSYEEVNIEKSLEYIGTEFQNVPLTLYKYPHYLFKKRYGYETVEEIAEIDNAFASHIANIGGKCLASIYITIHGKPIGFLCASFHTEPILSEDKIKEKMENSARILKPLLDLETQLHQNK